MCKNENLYYENKSLIERMNQINYDDISNKHIKSTVKGKLSVNYWENAINPHTSNLNIFSCSSSGKKIQSDSPFNYPPDFENAKLKHYQYKSFEEYCLKIKRGVGDSPKEISKEFVKQNYKRLYLENINNEEKLRIINNIFQVKFVTYNIA